MHFTDMLISSIQMKKSRLCVGLDPDFQKIPFLLKRSCGTNLEGVLSVISRFHHLIIEAIAPYAVAVKPQLAFFELLGPLGFQLLKETVKKAKDEDLLVILDGKRNDIGSTATAYARAYLGKTGFLQDQEDDLYGAHALTVNPFFGFDGLLPFFQEAKKWGKGVFLLVKTSNPSSSEIQDQILSSGESLSSYLAEKVSFWSNEYIGNEGYSLIGAVVGATASSTLLKLRKKMPKVFFLVPGIGEQGGRFTDIKDVFHEDGLGALINVSRSIIYASSSSSDTTEEEIQRSIEQKARYYRDGLEALIGGEE